MKYNKKDNKVHNIFEKYTKKKGKKINYNKFNRFVK